MIWKWIRIRNSEFTDPDPGGRGQFVTDPQDPNPDPGGRDQLVTDPPDNGSESGSAPLIFTFLSIGLPGEAADPQLFRHCPLQIVQDVRHRPQVIDRCVQRVAAPTLFQLYFGAIFSPSKKLAGKFKYLEYCRDGSSSPQGRFIFWASFSNKGMAGNLKLYPQYVAGPTLFPKKYNLFPAAFFRLPNTGIIFADRKGRKNK